jgi:hypothetical protein
MDVGGSVSVSLSKRGELATLWWRAGLAALLAGALGSPLAQSQQPGDLGPLADARQTVPLGGTADHVHVIEARRVSPSSDTLLITLRVDPGYHVNANPASSEYFIPTSVAFSEIMPSKVVYPPSIRFKPRFAEEAIDVYEGTVVITVVFPAGTLDRAHGLRFTVTAQACTELICLPPDELLGLVE